MNLVHGPSALYWWPVAGICGQVGLWLMSRDGYAGPFWTTLANVSLYLGFLLVAILIGWFCWDFVDSVLPGYQF